MLKKFSKWKYESKADQILENSETSKHSQKESEEKILEAYRESSKKLELIEQKYSTENSSLRRQLNQSNSELKERNDEIKKLLKKIKNLESVSNSVNEVV